MVRPAGYFKIQDFRNALAPATLRTLHRIALQRVDSTITSVGVNVPNDDLDIIADALRFLVGKAGGVERLPFDPFAAIERLRGRVLPELPPSWRIKVLPDGEVGLVRQRDHPPRCWEVWGEGTTFVDAVANALAKIGPDGFPFDDPEDDEVGWRVPGFLRLPAGGR
jgi:hypothetical protein